MRSPLLLMTNTDKDCKKQSFMEAATTTTGGDTDEMSNEFEAAAAATTTVLTVLKDSLSTPPSFGRRKTTRNSVFFDKSPIRLNRTNRTLFRYSHASVTPPDEESSTDTISPTVIMNTASPNSGLHSIRRSSGKRSVTEVVSPEQQDLRRPSKKSKSDLLSSQPSPPPLHHRKKLESVVNNKSFTPLRLSTQSVDSYSKDPLHASTSSFNLSPFNLIKNRILKPIMSSIGVKGEEKGGEQRQNPFILGDQQTTSLFNWGRQNPIKQRSMTLDLTNKFTDYSGQTDNKANAVPNFTSLPDLISEEIGGKILFATDDFFASAKNLLKPNEPKWNEGEFTPFGKSYDGWETRRRREPKHDWCIIELGVPGDIKGIEVNTRHFTGNYAPYFSLEGANIPNLQQQILSTYKKLKCVPYIDGQIGVCQDTLMIDALNELFEEQSKQDQSQWKDIVPMCPLLPGGEMETSKQHFSASSQTLPITTHIRFNLFPDGGIARLRVYGSGKRELSSNEDHNLSAVTNGAVVVCCSNQHFGTPTNLLLTTIPKNMGNGWETARNINRYPCLQKDEVTGLIMNLIGEEYVIIKLGSRGKIVRLEIDSQHFLGNYPESVQVQGIDLKEANLDDIEDQKNYFEMQKGPVGWKELIPRGRMFANHNHVWIIRRSRPKTSRKKDESELEDIGPITHIKVIIYPDGGIARVRAIGQVVSD